MRVSTTMCSGIVNRLLAARALNKDTDLVIPMRAQSHITLAPESGGGRSTAARSAPQAWGGCGPGHHLHHRICQAACMNLPFLFLAVATDVCSNFIFCCAIFKVWAQPLSEQVAQGSHVLID
eukprot:6204397-Pleurochrysis_carterae.AAC.3